MGSASERGQVGETGELVAAAAKEIARRVTSFFHLAFTHSLAQGEKSARIGRCRELPRASAQMTKQNLSPRARPGARVSYWRANKPNANVSRRRQGAARQTVLPARAGSGAFVCLSGQRAGCASRTEVGPRHLSSGAAWKQNSAAFALAVAAATLQMGATPSCAPRAHLRPPAARANMSRSRALGAGSQAAWAKTKAIYQLCQAPVCAANANQIAARPPSERRRALRGPRL